MLSIINHNHLLTTINNPKITDKRYYLYITQKHNTMNITTQKPASNDLRHTIITHDADGNNMTIKIRLNDECKNGHQDFAITADIYEKGKPKTDRYFICGGCCHDEIIKAKPKLKIFIDLHLCDYKGIPMHAVENGFYHLRNGFNEDKPGSEGFKTHFCEYYRITPNQFDALNQCDNKLQYALALQNLGILEQWETQANEGISILEGMTGKKFLVDSKKTQYNEPTPDEIQEEKQKQDSGYYTTEAKEKRAKAAKAKLHFDLLEEERGEIEKIRTEYAIKSQVLEI